MRTTPLESEALALRSRQMSRALAPPAVFLMGPTATGKTAVALELTTRLPLEIISVDSALVYRDMNIGTAKPDADTLAHVPHHLIDLITPEERYSAARFRTDALAAMADITARGKVPLLVGGTMLYFKALREGLAELPEADPALRAQLDERASHEGWPALHAELERLDWKTAARLKPTDAQRIQRALEVIRLTGRPMSELITPSNAASFPYRSIEFALLPSDRSVLHQRIATRFDTMLAHGLIEEVIALRAKYALHGALPAMRCVGYRQVWDYLEERITRSELRDKGIFATRQLAKRQLTWLRATPGKIELDCLAADLGERAAAAVEAALASDAR
jgi:tRNA dimethylallyltransferase